MKSRCEASNVNIDDRKEKKINYHLKLPEYVANWIREKSASEGRTASNTILQIIKSRMKEEQNEQVTG